MEAIEKGISDLVANHDIIAERQTGNILLATFARP